MREKRECYMCHASDTKIKLVRAGSVFSCKDNEACLLRLAELWHVSVILDAYKDKGV